MNETYKQGDLQRFNRDLEIYAAKEAVVEAARKLCENSDSLLLLIRLENAVQKLNELEQQQ